MKTRQEIHDLGPELLNELLEYRDDGILWWKRRDRKWFKSDRAANAWNSRNAGKEAFTAKTSEGYHEGRLLGQSFSRHVVVWAMHYCWPQNNNDVDHKDRDPHNDRVGNLREFSRTANSRNQGVRKNNTSGVTGVSFNSRHQRWQARITIEGSKQIGLGWFKNKEEAVEARKAAECKYWPEQRS